MRQQNYSTTNLDERFKNNNSVTTKPEMLNQKNFEVKLANKFGLKKKCDS